MLLSLLILIRPALFHVPLSKSPGVSGIPTWNILQAKMYILAVREWLVSRYQPEASLMRNRLTRSTCAEYIRLHDGDYR